MKLFSLTFLATRLKTSFKKIKNKPFLLIIFVVEFIFSFLNNSPFAINLLSFLFGASITFYVIGFPLKGLTVNKQIRQTALHNHEGAYPLLISVRKDKEINEYTFFNVGLPLADWQDKKEDLEAALNIAIGDINEAAGKQLIVIKAVNAKGALPEVAEWEDKYISEKCSVLKVGIGPLGVIEIDLSKIPHILIGGSTGSGKTVLLKCILHQLSKKSILIIADFKGGVDFPPEKWGLGNILCFDFNSVIAELKKLVAELENRKILFRTSGCPNIDNYNKKTGASLFRYIFACDEIAEMLDSTGADKYTKEQIKEVTGLLSTIARQGRAFGIHLIIATQRPDANILPGQIKNNIDCRICGKADNVLSQIILDNTSATEIPKSSQGRFIFTDGTMFQSYYYKD